jgi:hypothetical protein
MKNDTRNDVDDDVAAWAVIGAIAGGVTLLLWGVLLWQSIQG